MDFNIGLQINLSRDALYPIYWRIKSFVRMQQHCRHFLHFVECFKRALTLDIGIDFLGVTAGKVWIRILNECLDEVKETSRRCDLTCLIEAKFAIEDEIRKFRGYLNFINWYLECESDQFQ